MTPAKSWQDLCRAERHYSKFPKSPNRDKEDERERHKSEIFTAIAKGHNTNNKISNATGIPHQTVRFLVLSLLAEKKINHTVGKNNRVTYTIPGHETDPEPVEKYPGTIVIYRENAEPNRSMTTKQHQNPIRLAMEPWLQRDDEFLQASTAKTAGSISTGKNGGVSYAAGGDA